MPQVVSRFEHPVELLFELPQVLPLLMAVLDVSATMPEELFGNVTREAKKCLSQHLDRQEQQVFIVFAALLEIP